MIKDPTGIYLTPGNEGKDCLGNGEHFDEQGNPIQCCCDECDYTACCLPENFFEGYSEKLLSPYNPESCKNCKDKKCPRKKAIIY